MATTADAEPQGSESGGKSKVFLLLTLALFAIGGALGFFGVTSGLIPLGESHAPEAVEEHAISDLPDVAFVPIPTLIVTLPHDAKSTHLRFSAQIEVPSEFRSEVEFLMPRIQDLMNGYLRALTAEDIEGPGALYEIRLQLFRRVVMVVGLGRANGLLVTEFMLN